MVARIFEFLYFGIPSDVSHEICRFCSPERRDRGSDSHNPVGLGTRLSRNEIVVRQTFDKVSMGSDFPIVGIDVVAGLKNILNGDYEYYRLELSVKMISILPR